MFFALLADAEKVVLCTNTHLVFHIIGPSVRAGPAGSLARNTLYVPFSSKPFFSSSLSPTLLFSYLLLLSSFAPLLLIFFLSLGFSATLSLPIPLFSSHPLLCLPLPSPVLFLPTTLPLQRVQLFAVFSCEHDFLWLIVFCAPDTVSLITVWYKGNWVHLNHRPDVLGQRTNLRAHIHMTWS